MVVEVELGLVEATLVAVGMVNLGEPVVTSSTLVCLVFLVVVVVVVDMLVVLGKVTSSFRTKGSFSLRPKNSLNIRSFGKLMPLLVLVIDLLASTWVPTLSSVELELELFGKVELTTIGLKVVLSNLLAGAIGSFVASGVAVVIWLGSTANLRFI